MVAQERWSQMAGRQEFPPVDSSCDDFHVCTCFSACLPASVSHEALAPTSNSVHYSTAVISGDCSHTVRISGCLCVLGKNRSVICIK